MIADTPAGSARRRRLPLEPSRMPMLVFVPLALAARWLRWNALAVFSFGALAIIPLAGTIGEAPEQLAARRRRGSALERHFYPTVGHAGRLYSSP